MKQQKLIDVSLMGPNYVPRQVPSSPSSSRGSIARCHRRMVKTANPRLRHSSPRSSEHSAVTTTTTTTALDRSTNNKSFMQFNGTSSTSIPTLSVNGKSVDSGVTSGGSSRVTSGISLATLTSRTSSSRRRSVMTSLTAGSSAICSFAAFLDNIGLLPGLSIWTIENGQFRELSSPEHGFFHEGNVYLVLRMHLDGSSSLHVWFGCLSKQVDQQKIDVYGNHLDIIVQGAGCFSHETQGKETVLFLQHFSPALIVVEGKSHGLLSRNGKYTKRLYRVKGRKFSTATCINCNRSALLPEHALVLDGFPRIYVWLGSEVDSNTKVKTIEVASCIRRYQRKGIGHIVVIGKDDVSLQKAFEQKLSHDEDGCPENAPLETPEKSHLNLYRVNGERVMYDMPFVATKPLQHKYLTTRDCFLLDQGPNKPLYIWVGSDAESDTLYAAHHRAQNLAQHHNYPLTTPICRLVEGSEPLAFKSVFNGWVDRLVGDRQIVRTYNVANVGRALSSRSDCRTISQMSELWSDDQFVHLNGTTEVWRIDGTDLVPLMWEQRGIFHNTQCYVVLYTALLKQPGTRVLYYWMGSKCFNEQRLLSMKAILALSSTYQHHTCIIRILDGKEPKHFMEALQNSMVVYDSDLRNRHVEDNNCDARLAPICLENDDIPKMFCVREFIPGSMRVVQVTPATSSLNSSASFVIFNNYVANVWYGKNSTASEREYAKNMLSYFCPDRIHNFDVIHENREPPKFYSYVMNDGPYPEQFVKHVIHRRQPRLALYSLSDESFSFYDDFSQTDLNEADIFVLDTFDQIQVWIGDISLKENLSSSLIDIVKTYFEKDCAGRDMTEIHVCYVFQNKEPEVFNKYFQDWGQYGYGGNSALEAARKRARQENATIDIDCQMIDPTYATTTKFSYTNLVKGTNLDSHVDLLHKEHYLSDKEFTKVLNMTRSEFYRLPQWKRQQILKSAKLAGGNKQTKNASPDHQDPSDFSDDVLSFVKNCNKLYY